MSARYDLTPFETWEAVALDGVHAGFLHRRLADGVLTTRMAFQPTGAQRRERADLPQRYLAQARVRFSADGSTWEVCDFEDSLTTQNVRIARERAGLGADVVPSWAEHLLITAQRTPEHDGAPYLRLEESSPLQGPVRMPPAVLRIGAREAVPAAGPAGSEAGQARPEGLRVEVVSEGHVLAVHWLGEPATEGRRPLVASDWGGGTVSVPVATAAAALEGLPADLHTFAQLPTD